MPHPLTLDIHRQPDAPFALAIHGGAGTLSRTARTPEQTAAFHAGLRAALLAGQAVLAAGGDALSAVITAVTVLEDDPLFNAGRGAVYTHGGRHELDAAVMDGSTGRAGAVAGVRTLRNPVQAAQAVMQHSPHVLMIGEGAEQLAVAAGLASVPPEYFATPHRWAQLEAVRSAAVTVLDHDGAPPDGKYGTVGAVACDRHGHLAAATSTGGMTNKRDGRVGDSPLIGAGTFAEDATAAISGTGMGEAFIQGVVAYDIAARCRYAGQTLPDAVSATIATALTARQAEGGVIAVNQAREIVLGFNSEGMYRGYVLGRSAPQVAIDRSGR